MIIKEKEVLVSGGLLKIAKLKGEYHEWLDDPHAFLAAITEGHSGADVFTFVQRLTDREPKYDFHLEWQDIAALPITTYDNWLKRQINDKTRNMIRRSQKAGVEVHLVDFTEELINGIKKIYDECPVRQGKPFKHYGKPVESLRDSHITYLERSQFLGAYYQDELIGFIKLVHDGPVSDVMHIISMVSHRDKAPTNALLAKAVEVCAARGSSYLQYGPWKGRSLIDFKKHHAFECFRVPRYFIPLNIKGKALLCLKLHKDLSTLLPEKWIWVLISIRNKLNAVRYNGQ